MARGFSATPRSDLAEPFAAKYFETVDWVWANKTAHMADALLNGLYPGYADPATLVRLGDTWLDEHIAADNALRRLIVENVASSTAPSRFATTKRSDFLLAPRARGELSPQATEGNHFRELRPHSNIKAKPILNSVFSPLKAGNMPVDERQGYGNDCGFP